MSVADLLNTDVEVVGARLRGAAQWWLDELRDAAAPLLREGVRRRPEVLAHRGVDGGFDLRRQDGLPGPVGVDRRGADVALVLPADAVVVRELPAPPLPERDLRRAILLDLDRLTPFPPDTAYATLAIVRAEVAGERSLVRLAVAPRARVDRELADARAAGLQVKAVLPAGEADATLDLLPAVGGRGGRAAPLVVRAWIAVALLLALNLGATVWRDMRDTARLQAAVAAEQPVAERVRRLTRETAALRTGANERAAALAAGDPLRVLDALSRALPDAAYAQRIAWDGAGVRVAGQQRGGVDVVEALRREPVLADVRSADATTAADAAFDVTATVRRPAGAGPAPVARTSPAQTSLPQGSLLKAEP